MGRVAVILSPLTAAWLEEFQTWRNDPTLRSEYDDFGAHSPGGISRAFDENGPPDIRLVLVSDQDALAGRDAVAGMASWVARDYGPNAESRAWNIGVSLRPEWRDRGIGTEAHRQLVTHLFDTTGAYRLEAGTDVVNAPERAVLTKVGFTFEGIARGAQHRQREYHDVAMYGLLRGDQRP
jgi:RimJ/RimL family protein N-acetyltransferase